MLKNYVIIGAIKHEVDKIIFELPQVSIASQVLC